MTSQHAQRLIVVVFGLSLACFAAYQQFKLPVVLPVLLERYGYDRTLAGGFMSIYALVGLCLSMPLGRLIERFGHQRPIQGALGLFVLAALLPLFDAGSGLVVLFSRFLEGIAFAVLAISGPVIANACASPRQLPIVVGFTAAWIPVGQLSATLLAPLALWAGAWQLLWLLGIVGALAFLVWTLSVAAFLPGDQAGAKAARPTMDNKDNDPRRRERASGREQGRAFVLTGGIFMLWSCQYFAYMTWLPQYLVEVHALPVAGAIAGYVVPVFMVMVMCILTGVLLRAGASLRWLLVGSLAAQAFVWALVPWTGSGLAGIASLVVYGTSAGIVPACLFAMPSAILRGGANTTRAFAIVMTGRNIGVLIGPVLLAQAFHWTGTWHWSAPIFTLVTALSLPLAIVLAVWLGNSEASQAEAAG